MANLQYGSNKVDTSLSNISSQWKVVKHTVTVDDTGVAASSPVVVDGIPANFQPVLCTVKNISTESGDDFGASACILVDDTAPANELTMTLSGLAAGAELSFVCENTMNGAATAVAATANDIDAKTASFKAAAGKTITCEIILSGWDCSAVAGLIGE